MRETFLGNGPMMMLYYDVCYGLNGTTKRTKGRMLEAHRHYHAFLCLSRKLSFSTSFNSPTHLPILNPSTQSHKQANNPINTKPLVTATSTPTLIPPFCTPVGSAVTVPTAPPPPLIVSPACHPLCVTVPATNTVCTVPSAPVVTDSVPVTPPWMITSSPTSFVTVSAVPPPALGFVPSVGLGVGARCAPWMTTVSPRELVSVICRPSGTLSPDPEDPEPGFGLLGSDPEPEPPGGGGSPVATTVAPCAFVVM